MVLRMFFCIQRVFFMVDEAAILGEFVEVVF